jgi:hypothetical protein
MSDKRNNLSERRSVPVCWHLAIPRNPSPEARPVRCGRGAQGTACLADLRRRARLQQTLIENVWHMSSSPMTA